MIRNQAEKIEESENDQKRKKNAKPRMNSTGNFYGGRCGRIKLPLIEKNTSAGAGAGAGGVGVGAAGCCTKPAATSTEISLFLLEDCKHESMTVKQEPIVFWGDHV